MAHADGAAPRAGGRWPAASVLGSLQGDSLERMLRLGTRVRYTAGQLMIRQDETSTHVFILLSGMVKATVITREGTEVMLAMRMGGDLVGEFAAVDSRPRSATITTCGKVEGRAVRQAEYLACLRDDPQIAVAVQRSLIGKVRAANMRRVDFADCDVPARVARALHDLAVSYGDVDGNQAVIRYLSQPELATLIGAAEPSTHRALRELRAQGIAETGYRQITILDLKRLTEIAERLPVPRAGLRPRQPPGGCGPRSR